MLGLGSFVLPVLLLLPVVAVVLAVVAAVQVLRSHGTQAGLPLAIAAAIGSLLILGTLGFNRASVALEEVNARRSASNTIDGFGNALMTDPAAAYDYLDANLQSQMSAADFARSFAGYEAMRDQNGEPVFGPPVKVEAGGRILIGEAPDERPQAVTELVVFFETGRAVAQRAVIRPDDAGVWQFAALDSWFQPTE